MSPQGGKMPTTEQVAHTPGPWRLVDLRHQKSSTIRIFSERNGRVANVLTGSGFVRTERANDCEANARLIAAAPELLACLKEAIELIQEDIDNRDGRDNFGMCCGNCEGAIPIEHSFGCRARAAISKAEGGK